MSSPRWLPSLLARVRELATRQKVRFTLKALQELAALDLGLDEEDACHVLANLAPGDFVKRLASRQTGEWLYIFRPTVAEVVLYVKVILRVDCVVISFHENEDQGDEKD